MTRIARCILVILSDLGWGFLWTLAALGLAILAAQAVLIIAAAMASSGCTYDSLISVHYHAAPRAAPAGRDPGQRDPEQDEEPPTTSGPAAGPDEDPDLQTPTEIIDEAIERLEHPGGGGESAAQP